MEKLQLPVWKSDQRGMEQLGYTAPSQVIGKSRVSLPQWPPFRHRRKHWGDVLLRPGVPGLALGVSGPRTQPLWV